MEIQAELQGIQLNNNIEAGTARWVINPAGIRLSIECQDIKTQRRYQVQARMDFHYRGPEGEKSERKQAALDLEGIFLTDAIKTFLGKKGAGHQSDYHRAEFLDQVIKSDEDFAAIRKGRQRQIQEALNRYWAERGVALSA